MKNKQLFDKTVGILVKSYMNDTLQHGTCTACAVGNIICHNMYNGDHRKWWQTFFANVLNGDGSWSHVFSTAPDDTGKLSQRFDASRCVDAALEQVKSTGYTVEELAQIEYAFEIVTQDKDPKIELNVSDCPKDIKDHYMFKGLVSVYETLCDIHEVTAEDEVLEVELVFCK